MALSKNLEKNTSFETREAIKESAEVEKAPKKTQGKQFNWSSIAKQENPESVLSNFFQDLYSIPGDQEEATQSERRHWVELWKNLRMDCAGGMLISPKETGKSLEVEKRDRLTGSDHMAVLFDSCGTRSGGRNVFVQVQADRWLVRDAKNLGLRMAQITPSTAVRKCAESVCAEDTRRCWSVLAAASSRTIARMAEREIVVVQLDVKKAFDHVDHRAGFKAMRLQGASLFSMALIAALWNGSCMKARLGTVLSSKVRMSRGLPQGAPESPVIFTMVMELVLRDLIKSWRTRKLAWRLWRLEPLPFTVQPPATAGMPWHGVGKLDSDRVVVPEGARPKTEEQKRTLLVRCCRGSSSERDLTGEWESLLDRGSEAGDTKHEQEENRTKERGRDRGADRIPPCRTHK